MWGREVCSQRGWVLWVGEEGGESGVERVCSQRGWVGEEGGGSGVERVYSHHFGCSLSSENRST